jgi:hypothetical protein
MQRILYTPLETSRFRGVKERISRRRKNAKNVLTINTTAWYTYSHTYGEFQSSLNWENGVKRRRNSTTRFWQKRDVTA